MKVIFSREDFTLCNVPVPKGYPQSQTHCGIVYFGGRYFLTTSPYPNPNRSIWLRYFAAIIRKLSFKKINILYKGEDFENPMLYEAVQFTDYRIPFGFNIIEGSPLMHKPKDLYGAGSFCSDPDISIIDGKIFVLNRATVRGNKKNGTKDETIVHLIKGTIEERRFKQEDIKRLFIEGYKSPCLTKIGMTYHYFCLDTNSYNDGTPCKTFIHRVSTDLINWSNLNPMQIIKGFFEPWHMSVFQYNGHLYSIVACVKKGENKRCWQLLGEFNEDITELKIYNTPLTDYKSYRGSALVDEKGMFVLYSTTVHEKIKGSKAVDGRDVIMAHMPFEQLLETLRKNENE